MVAGGVDVVPCSIPEARAMIDAGKARSLAVMSAERNPAFKDVPTLKEAMGLDYATSGAWRGFAGPKGLPQEVAASMTAALKKVNESAEFREFMANRGFGVKWADGAGFARFMEEGDKAMGAAMKAAGLAKG
jgi:tripartite-type tricarboxylate transporter receptor subunit TctC